jgi:hypothetical protein
LLATFVLASISRADETVILSATRVQVRVSSPWPAGINKGCAPIFIDLTNLSSDRREVELQAMGSDWYARSEIAQTLELAPGESAHLEWLAPVGANSSEYTLIARSGSDEHYFTSAAARMPRNVQIQAILAIGPKLDDRTATLARWTSEISTDPVTNPYAAASGATPSNDNLQFGFASFDELPQSAAAYTSLDLAVIDASESLPPRAQLEPLVAWVRSGGDLLVLGLSADAIRAADEGLAAWMEQRFAVSAAGGVDTFQCGLGRLTVLDGEGFLENSDHRDVVRDLASAKTSMVPDPSGSRTDGSRPNIPGLGEIPTASSPSCWSCSRS